MANVHEGHSGLRFRGELPEHLTFGDLDGGQATVLEPGQDLGLVSDEGDLEAGHVGLLRPGAGDLGLEGLEAVVEYLKAKIDELKFAMRLVVRSQTCTRPSE